MTAFTAIARGLVEIGAKAMKTNSQQNDSGPLPLENDQQSPTDAPTDSGLRGLFQRFLALEAEGTAVNKRKAKIFAEAKEDGFEPKALRIAFRQRLREMKNPEETAKHGELTDSYLLILRSEGNGDAGTSDSSPVSVPSEPAPDALARSHAHTRTRDSGSHDTDLLILCSEGSGDAGTSDPSPVSLAPGEPAPDALARSHVHTRTRDSGSHDTDLLILRSGDAGTSDSLPASLAPAESAPDALARSHAHTRTSESVSHDTDGAVISWSV